MALERNKLAAVVEDFAVTYRTGAVDHLQDRPAPRRDLAGRRSGPRVPEAR